MARIEKGYNTMRKNEFADAMKDYASKYGEAVIDTIDKGSRIYLGLYVKKDKTPTPVVNLDALYEVYREEGVDACWEVIDHIISTPPEFDMATVISIVTDWEQVNNHLMMRTLDKEAATAGIYQRVGQFYMCPYIRLDESSLIRVTPDLLEIWKKSKEEVIGYAVCNDIVNIYGDIEEEKV